MSFKKSALYATVALKCPRCRKGDLFKTRSAYAKGMAEMHKKCACCGESFTREPGYYFGAAYVSYALTIALWVGVFVALSVFDAIGLMSFSMSEDAILFIVTGVLLLLLLALPIYRLSRSAWIHMFVKYRPDSGDCNPE